MDLFLETICFCLETIYFLFLVIWLKRVGCGSVSTALKPFGSLQKVLVFLCQLFVFWMVGLEAKRLCCWFPAHKWARECQAEVRISPRAIGDCVGRWWYCRGAGTSTFFRERSSDSSSGSMPSWLSFVATLCQTRLGSCSEVAFESWFPSRSGISLQTSYDLTSLCGLGR